MRTLRDLKCSNDKCGDPTTLQSQLVERYDDGTIILEKDDGEKMIPVCEGCGAELVCELSRFSIGRALKGEAAPDGSFYSPNKPSSFYVPDGQPVLGGSITLTNREDGKVVCGKVISTTTDDNGKLQGIITSSSEHEYLN